MCIRDRSWAPPGQVHRAAGGAPPGWGGPALAGRDGARTGSAGAHGGSPRKPRPWSAPPSRLRTPAGLA
eukprot:8886401-Alexandrium_andersonii.AAC.1